MVSMRIQTQILDLSSSPLTSKQHPVEKLWIMVWGAYTSRIKLPSVSKCVSQPWPLLHLRKFQRLKGWKRTALFPNFPENSYWNAKLLWFDYVSWQCSNVQDFSCSTSSIPSKKLGYWGTGCNPWHTPTMPSELKAAVKFATQNSKLHRCVDCSFCSPRVDSNL